jgi:hypothetical protein
MHINDAKREKLKSLKIKRDRKNECMKEEIMNNNNKNNDNNNNNNNNNYYLFIYSFIFF